MPAGASTRPCSPSRRRTSGDACDVFLPVYEATGGRDGRVSIEVDPRLAHDTAGTVAEARSLAAAVDRPNVLIKIPATVEGLPAITQVLGAGISVNVTLIFALDRYRAVMNAFLSGLEQAREGGADLSGLHSVASFFVSRVDTEVDKRLDEIGTDEAKALRGKAGIANARLAYQAYEEVFGTPRWQSLADAGANPAAPAVGFDRCQGPGLPGHDVRHRARGARHRQHDAREDPRRRGGPRARSPATRSRPFYAEAAEVLDSLERLGISYSEVTAQLEREGVDKFEKSWGELLDGVSRELEKATA